MSIDVRCVMELGEVVYVVARNSKTRRRQLLLIVTLAQRESMFLSPWFMDPRYARMTI